MSLHPEHVELHVSADRKSLPLAWMPLVRFDSPLVVCDIARMAAAGMPRPDGVQSLPETERVLRPPGTREFRELFLRARDAG